MKKKPIKMSLSAIQGELTRSEMKKIMAGSSSRCLTFALCANGEHCHIIPAGCVCGAGGNPQWDSWCNQQ